MNGIIIINKSKGCTSHDIVYKVKKMFNEKVGHTGTLDPMATGVLPLLIGKATLCSKYLINHDKIYEVKLKLGIKTDTADGEGNIIEEVIVNKQILEKENVEKKLKMFLGKQKQMPPIYSAIKINGKKLYEYARKGQKVEIQPRDIIIYNINLISINIEENIISFRVECSKGTYIRSLCEDIAKKMGTIGYMAELNRIQVGEFNIANSISLEELESLWDKSNKLENIFIKIEDIFINNEIINIDKDKLQMFLNGVKLQILKPDGVYKIYCNKKFIGTGIIKNKNIKRDIII